MIRKLSILITTALLFMIACAPYSQLKPKVDLSPAEQGYLELKQDEKKPFKLGKDGKYYVAFPAPQEDNYYLVLTLPDKQKFRSFAVDAYKGSTLGNKITDEAPADAKMSVYPINRNSPVYYWMVENGPAELELAMQYRYAPQWRFKYETKAAQYRSTYDANLVDRTLYTTLGTSFHFENFGFQTVIDSVKRKLGELDKVQKELLAIEIIFPKSILNSTDKAYLDYKDLRSKLDEEMLFQSNWLLALDFFNKEQLSRKDPLVLMGMIDDFVAYFSQKGKLPPNVVQESQNVLTRRMGDVGPYFEKQLGAKIDGLPLDTVAYAVRSLNRLPALYEAAGPALPPAFADLIRFVNDFDKAARAFVTAKESLAGIYKSVKDQGPMPPNDFFPAIVAKLTAVQQTLPQPLGTAYGKYQQYPCTQKLNDELTKATTELATRLAQCRVAQDVVIQVNALLGQNDVRTAIAALRQNTQLSFLTEKYRRLDTLSIQSHDRKTREALGSKRWQQAEVQLRTLYTDDTFLYPSAVAAMQDQLVKDLEDSLYVGVDRITRQRVDKFLEEKVNTLENVDSLYTDSVFLPAYDIAFSTGSKKSLVQRKDSLVAHLAKLKINEFPAKAIALLYEQFTKNPDDNGVLKCRAIVTHGKHYQGTDEKTKRRIAECDPLQAKWITEAKQYRRLYVVPVSDKKKGENKYVFRVNVRIPTEAEFPVYDINVKLPKEVAQNAGDKQWYEKITMNDKELKNEGRFSITAPTAANEYECQITPVSMNKEGSNILEVSFTHGSWKVLIVSVMAQKPIIKKN